MDVVATREQILVSYIDGMRRFAIKLSQMAKKPFSKGVLISKFEGRYAFILLMVLICY